MTDDLYLDTTVTELMQLFRDALIALIPVMDRARIAWRDPDAYDDWDAICQTLFEQMVVNSIQHSLPEGQHIQVAGWGVRQSDYTDVDRIVAGPEADLIVVDLATCVTPFDTVIALEVATSGLSGEPVEFPFTETEFAFVHRSGGNLVVKGLRVFL